MPLRRVYHDSTDVDSVESRFSDMSMGMHGGGYDSHNGSPFKSGGMAHLHGPYPSGSRPMSYERDSWMPSCAYTSGGYPYPGEYGYASKYSSTGSDTVSVVSGDGRYRDLAYNGFQVPFEQPAPPPPRQPSATAAGAATGPNAMEKPTCRWELFTI